MDDDCPKCNIENCNIEKCIPKIPELNSYLDKDIINSDGDGFNREKILNTIFGDKTYDKITKDISKKVKDFLSNKQSDKKGWIECSYSGGANSIRRIHRTAFKKTNACSLIGQYGELELNSTAYMLRVLTKAVLGNKNKPIRFNVENGSTLTGIWNNDKNHIYFENDNKNPNKEGMLIMGFGPSASGKSFMGEQIIEIMKNAIVDGKTFSTIGDDKTFSDLFFNIDGGEYRELSVVYQSVIKGIKDYTLTQVEGYEEAKKCMNQGNNDDGDNESYGFPAIVGDNDSNGVQGVGDKESYGFTADYHGDNELYGFQGSVGNTTTVGGGCVPCKIQDYLILANYKGIKDLKKFIDTSSIKSKVKEYLETQKKNKHFIPNLYVPDTLVSCGTGYDRCMAKIKEYVKLTNSQNRWISTLIYQHKTEESCDKSVKFKCLGTTAKGRSREKCESKIYDDSNWDKGYTMGEKYTERGTYRDTYTPGLVLRIHNSGDKNRQSTLESVKLGGDYYKSIENKLLDKFKIVGFYTEKVNIKYGGGTRKRVRRTNIKGQKKTIRKKKCGQQKRTRKTKNIKKTKKNRKTRKYKK